MGRKPKSILPKSKILLQDDYSKEDIDYTFLHDLYYEAYGSKTNKGTWTIPVFRRKELEDLKRGKRNFKYNEDSIPRKKEGN